MGRKRRHASPEAGTASAPDPKEHAKARIVTDAPRTGDGRYRRVRGKKIMVAAEQRANEARAHLRAEQATAVVVADPDVGSDARACRSADGADKRCPFRRPDRAADWLNGFDGQHTSA